MSDREPLRRDVIRLALHAAGGYRKIVAVAEAWMALHPDDPPIDVEADRLAADACERIAATCLARQRVTDADRKRLTDAVSAGRKRDEWQN